MVNYKNGKIYKVVSDQTDKIYIGSTAEKYLSKRIAGHRNKYLKYLEGENRYVTSYDIIQYGDARIILIESYPCNFKEELLAREQYWIETMKDKIVNKQNAKGHSREKTLKRQKKYRDSEKGKIFEKSTERKMWKKNYRISKKNCIYCDEEITKNNFSAHCKSEKHNRNVEYCNRILNNLD